jgi:hypothetical protein
MILMEMGVLLRPLWTRLQPRHGSYSIVSLCCMLAGPMSVKGTASAVP